MNRDAQLAKRSWIFQAVPRYFDLIEALKQIHIFRWRVNQFKNEIRAGDDVYLWLAGTDGGMVARGTTLTNPQFMHDTPEELPFVREGDGNIERISTAIKIDTVFLQPVQRATLQNHPVLSSISLLQNTRGTNFPLTDIQAKALDVLCPQAKMQRTSLAEAFARFRSNSVEQMRVKLRRKRSEQLRSLRTDVDDINLNKFNRDVWQSESATLLNGNDICGRLFDRKPPNVDLCEQVAEALEAGTLEMHGNYVWRPASSVFGSSLTKATDEEKERHIRTAIGMLFDNTLTTTEKAEKITAVPGFGPTSASGLVMVFHSKEFAIWDKQSKGAFSKLGLSSDTLAEFQKNAARMKERLGAEDFLELDWFLYQVNQGLIQIIDQELLAKMLRGIDDEIQNNLVKSSAESQTEKEQLIKSRIGQGLFRLNIQHFESACRVCGVNDSRFLIASHIKPWRACNNKERLDGANGLLLSPNIDRLFDRGYISFDDDGTLLVASGIDAATLRVLGIPLERTNCGEFSPMQMQYLSYHRQHIFLGSTE